MQTVESCPILVVDDDPDLRSVISDVLELEGYPVAVAGDGAEALEVVEDVKPPLVLLDPTMPVLNGREFIQTLRDRGVDAPVLIMTGSEDADGWARQVGAAGVIKKPFELDELLDTVERQCRPKPWWRFW
ncbi:MAG TPA: response regulator [Dehalococcoidia bacterium]|nr:response regulator [Dehalococcoidia bacterium]